MKAYVVFFGNGPLVILTSHNTITDPALLRKLEAKGISRFIAFEVPLDLARARYGEHFEVVMEDLSETDDLRVLDFDGNRAFATFSFAEMGIPTFYDGHQAYQRPTMIEASA